MRQKPERKCKCGCGEFSAKYYNPDGKFKGYQLYAEGHWQKKYETDVKKRQLVKKCPNCRVVKSTDEFYKKLDKRRGRNYNRFSTYCKECLPKLTREWTSRDPAKSKKQRRKAALKKSFGISLEFYNNLLISQNGACAGCGTDKNYMDKALAVDHSHFNGTVRGLLCNDCNLALGKLRENPKTLRNLAGYIEKNTVDVLQLKLPFNEETVDEPINN